MIERQMMWSPHEAVGLEHLTIQLSEVGASADGEILGLSENLPFRLNYQIHTNVKWQVRRVSVFTPDPYKVVRLESDGSGNWKSDTNDLGSALEGCLDVDISGTPFTNTLPIRRLSLCENESAEIDVVYLSVPQLDVQRKRQRYTRLADSSGGQQYRFDALGSEYTNVITVDPEGFVLEYPALFSRVFG